VEEARGDARLIQRLAKLQYRFYDRMRHKDAFHVAREPGTAPDFEGMRGAHYCLFVTFKRSGEPVPTPVVFGLEDGKVYLRTESHVGKVRRIRNNPRVRVGPCNWRAKPKAPLAEGTARLLAPEENERAYGVLKRNYTFGLRQYESTIDRLPVELVYVEVSPSPLRAEG
jgi:PPOX class probable F420-dependent enzyme